MAGQSPHKRQETAPIMSRRPSPSVGDACACRACQAQLQVPQAQSVALRHWLAEAFRRVLWTAPRNRLRAAGVLCTSDPAPIDTRKPGPAYRFAGVEPEAPDIFPSAARCEF